ncbi:MAG: GatB/YqeY domain-containing protein [Myxococcota bacterium]
MASMTSLQERIGNDWKEAMKARDPKKDVLSLMKTEIKNKAISSRTDGAAGTELGDAAALDVLMKMAKQRRESIESFKAGARQDLADKEALELATIELYLPSALTDSELEALVQDVAKEIGAEGPKDMGKLMKAVMTKAAGGADGNRVQVMVRKCLG